MDSKAYFITQGVIGFFSTFVTIDICIDPGSGGDMWAKFQLVLALGGKDLGEARLDGVQYLSRHITRDGVQYLSRHITRGAGRTPRASLHHKARAEM